MTNLFTNNHTHAQALMREFKDIVQQHKSLLPGPKQVAKAYPKTVAEEISENNQKQLQRATDGNKIHDALMIRSFQSFEAMVNEAVIVEARNRESVRRNPASFGGGRKNGGQRPPAAYGVIGVDQPTSSGEPTHDESIRALGSTPGWRPTGTSSNAESRPRPESRSIV